jgi:alkyl sulfatase BDS1-like metallo-beta-lactamase superfamily hydrolase
LLRFHAAADHLSEAVADGRIAIEGEAAKLHELLSLFDTFGPIFEIVEQKQPRAR